MSLSHPPPPPLSHPSSLSSARNAHAVSSYSSSPSVVSGSDPYIRVKQLGQGSFGRVLLVRDARDQQLYVMKEIDLQQFGSKGRKEAMKEVSFLNQLAHPYIITYKEFFERNTSGGGGGGGGGSGGPVHLGKDGRPDPAWVDSSAHKRMLFIVMEYADGGDLDAKIKRQKKLHGGALFPEAQVIQWFVQIVLGLKHIHDRRILHRDIKSENIFLMRDHDGGSGCKIGDFGISKHLNNTMAQALTRIGTPYYLSPEICMNKPYNQKSDIWSLGVVLYELCTLRHPFDATSMESLLKKIVKGQHGPLNARQYSPELRALVDQLLAKDPRRRPSINEICRIDWLQSHIVRHLPPAVLSSEFSHTMIHDYQPPAVMDLPALGGGYTHPPPGPSAAAAAANQQAQALALIKKRKAAAAAAAVAVAQSQAYPNYALPPPTKPHAYPAINGSQHHQQQAPHAGIRAVAKKPKNPQTRGAVGVGSGSELGSDDDLAHLPSPYAAKHPPPREHRYAPDGGAIGGVGSGDDAEDGSSQPMQQQQQQQQHPNYGQHNAGARLKKNQARAPPLLPPTSQQQQHQQHQLHSPAAAMHDSRDGPISPGSQARYLSGAPIDEREHRRFREYEQALMVQHERERELERERQKERELQKQLVLIKAGGGGGGGGGWQQQQQQPQPAFVPSVAAHAMSDGATRRRRAHAPPALGSGPLPSSSAHAAAALPFNPNDLPPAGMHPPIGGQRGAAPHRGDRDRNTTHDLLAHQDASAGGGGEYPPLDGGGSEYAHGATHVRASERARREDELAAIRETYMLEKATRKAARLAEQEKTRNHILPVGRGGPSPNGAHQLGPAAAAAQQAMMQSHSGAGSHAHASSLQAPYAQHLPSPHRAPSQHQQLQHQSSNSQLPPPRRSGIPAVAASPPVLPASAYRDAAGASAVYDEIYESDSVSPPPPPVLQAGVSNGGGGGAEIEEEDYPADEQSYEEDFDDSPLPPPRQISVQQQQQQQSKLPSYSAHEKTQPRFPPPPQQQQQQPLHQLHAPPPPAASRNYPPRSHPANHSSVSYNVPPPPPSQLNPLHHPQLQQQRKGIPAATRAQQGGGGGGGGGAAKKGHPAMHGQQLAKVGGGGWNRAH